MRANHFLLSTTLALLRSVLAAIKWATVVIVGTAAIILLIPLGMMLVGYRVNADSGEVALLAAKKGDVEICGSIMNYGLFGPPSGESRAHCVYRFAKLTQDPSACELLMPSEYGFSCIGAAGNGKRLCTVDFGRIVEWGSYLDGTRQKATLKNCVSGNVPLGLGQQCCIISKVANLRGFDDCSALSGNTALHDECLSQLALKTGNAEICGPITETGSRIACNLRTKYKSALRTLPPPIDVETLNSD